MSVFAESLPDFDMISSIFTEELNHIGGFLAGAAAVLTVMLPAVIYATSCICKRSTKAAIEATTSSMQAFVQSRMMQTIKDMDPASFYTLDLHFQNGLSIVAPMLPDRPLYVSENIQIKVIAHSISETTLMLTCKGFGHFIPHYHAHTCETIEIREGTMTCCETGQVYRKGDVWKIAAGEMHSAQFQDCIAIISHKPPLPTAAERPVNLKDVAKIFPPP